MRATRDSGGEVRLGTEAGCTEYLASQVLHPVDARLAENPPIEFFRNRGDDHGISAGEIGLDRTGATRLNDRQLPRQHRLNRQRASRYADHFDVESVLFVIVTFLREPKRHFRRRSRATAYPEPFELLFLGEQVRRKTAAQHEYEADEDSATDHSFSFFLIGDSDALVINRCKHKRSPEITH